MLRIVMDSAGDIPQEWLMDFDIHVIPVNIHFGEKTYLQGVDLTNDGFYQLVEKTKSIPKTSQPSPKQFEFFYRKIAEPGDTILSIHVTSKLSGTYASAVITSKELKDEFSIYPVDSGAGSVSMGFMCKEAREMDRSGKGIQLILDRLSFIRKNTEVILTLETLEYARMSGRVKALQAALASLLNVKPIVELSDGILNVTEKVRTRSRSLERVVEKMRERFGNMLVNMAVVHAQDPGMGEKLLKRVKEYFNIKELILSDLSTGIAANLGPGTVGIIAYPA